VHTYLGVCLLLQVPRLCGDGCREHVEYILLFQWHSREVQCVHISVRTLAPLAFRLFTPSACTTFKTVCCTSTHIHCQ
jgi:hypothetical protein